MLLKTGTNSFFILLINFIFVLDDEIHSPKRRREMNSSISHAPSHGRVPRLCAIWRFSSPALRGKFQA